MISIILFLLVLHLTLCVISNGSRSKIPTRELHASVSDICVSMSDVYVVTVAVLLEIVMAGQMIY